MTNENNCSSTMLKKLDPQNICAQEAENPTLYRWQAATIYGKFVAEGVR
jgi:hypothetical protein